MTGYDIFAWIVLLILVASAIGVFCIAGWLPGHIAKITRASVGAGGDGRGLGHIALRLRAVAGRADLGLCRRAPAQGGSRRHDRRIHTVYLVLLFLLVHFKIVRFNLFWKLSPFIVLRAAAVRPVHPDGLGRAAGIGAGRAQCRGDRADVAGEVIEVPVDANTPLKAGDVLFRSIPCPTRRRSKAIEAQLKLSDDAACADDAIVSNAMPAAAFDVEQRQSEVDQLKAQLEGAQWNLDKTVVRAPADGYVTNLALRKGARVANLPLSPVMAFIDTSDTIIGVEISQIDARYIEPGQPVEVTFKFVPGTIYSGKVESVLQAISTGQAQTSGHGGDAQGGRSRAIRGPHEARRCRDSPESCRPAAPARPRSSPSTSSRPTSSASVLLRQVAIINYVNPF